VNLFNPLHRQNFTIGLLVELVGPVTGSNRDSQGIHLRGLHEALGFIGVGQQLIMRQLTRGTMAIFRFCRPVAWQSFPDAALPSELQDANPLGIRRME
jgi:hypothetical protein